MTGLEVVNRELKLPNEWQLGAGRRIVWAPEAPTMLDRPGFRDPGSYLGYPIDPVFAITLLDRDAQVIPLHANERNWTPARLELKYRLPQALITERRTVLSLDTFVCQWTMTHASTLAERFWLVLWTRRPGAERGHTLSDIEANAQGITYQEWAPERAGCDATPWCTAFGASFDADSWSVNGVESEGPTPTELAWESTPFYDLMAPGGLPGHLPASESGAGPTYLALAYPFEIPPGERLVVTLAAAIAPEVEQARNRLERCVSLINPIHVAEEEWINWFEDVPGFSCSDPYLQRLYWYRWSQLRLWDSVDRPRHDPPIDAEPEDPAPENLGRVIDGSWQHSTEQSAEQLWALFGADSSAITRQAFAHAARRVFALHPDAELRQSLDRRVGELAADLLEEAAPELAGADADGWPTAVCERATLALQTSVFACDLIRLVAWLRAGDPDRSARWREAAEAMVRRIDQAHWSDEQGFYCESATDEVEIRAAKTIRGFYPLLVGVPEERRAALLEALCDPERFWTTFPAPTISRDDPDFSPEGHRRNCRLARPKNGRVWPEETSHVIDGLAKRVESATASQRLTITTLIDRTLRLVFPDGDVDRPAFHEHYNPLNGRPARFAGRSICSGAWWVDHVMRYVAGIRPDENGRLVIDPLPFAIEWFAVDRVIVGEHEIEVEWDHRTGLNVRIDDESAIQAPVGQALSIHFPGHWHAEE